MTVVQILAILWIFCCGSRAQISRCMDSSSAGCSELHNVPFIPYTLEHLDDRCKYDIPALKCTIRESSRKCEEPELVALKYYKYNLDFMEFLCKKDSELYEGVIAGMYCFTKNYEDIMGNIGDVEFVNKTEFLYLMFENNTNILTKVSDDCKDRFYENSGIAVRTRHFCGERTQRALIQAMEWLKIHFYPCNEYVTENFASVVKIIEDNLNQTTYIN